MRKLKAGLLNTQEPKSHIVLAPTAEGVVKPTAAQASSRQMRGFAQPMVPEVVVKLAIA